MRVLLVTGSSGGHIFPALALAQLLNQQQTELLLVLPKSTREKNIPVTGIQIKYIPGVKLSFKIDRNNIIGLGRFLLGFWQSLLILLKFKPEVVVGFGSLNSIALIFWAWLFRIKTVIHEQNVICGRANNLLSSWVDKVAVSFAQTGDYLPIAKTKIVVTGNPLRREMVRVEKQAALDFFNFKQGKFNLMITGGSQGAHRLNLACWEALSVYPKPENLQVIHLCGGQDFLLLKNKYATLTLSSKLFDFFEAMQYAYSIADLVISRAGATTIAELQRFSIPAVLIPYPFAYAHQSDNAQILKQCGAARVIRDEEVTAKSISAVITEFIENPSRLDSLRRAYPPQAKQNATQLLAQVVLTAV